MDDDNKKEICARLEKALLASEYIKAGVCLRLLTKALGGQKRFGETLGISQGNVNKGLQSLAVEQCPTWLLQRFPEIRNTIGLEPGDPLVIDPEAINRTPIGFLLEAQRKLGRTLSAGTCIELLKQEFLTEALTNQ
jgi:hypothetical protein